MRNGGRKEKSKRKERKGREGKNLRYNRVSISGTLTNNKIKPKTPLQYKALRLRAFKTVETLLS